MKKVIPFLALTIALAAALVPLATGAPAATQTVRVNATSYRITLSAKPKAGTVRFVVRNVGDDEHDVWIRGGGRSAHTPVLAPGRSAAITMRLKRGVVYKFWCGVDDHASRGMLGSFRAR
jgi:uncharacterized cupredoxin-like copper-binding protein